MSSIIEVSRQQWLVFLFVLVRVAGLTIVMPALDARFAPRPARLLLPVAIAMLIAPLYWSQAGLVDRPVVELIAPLCREAVLGLVLSLTLLLLVAGMRAAGHAIGQFSGLSLAELIDPSNGGSSPLLGSVFAMLATAVFLLTDGHRRVLSGLLDTFAWMPPGQVGFSTGLVRTLGEVAGHSISLAFRVAAPVLLTLVLTSLALAVVGRLASQFNVLASGLAINSLVAWGAAVLGMASAAWMFHDQAQVSFEAIWQAMARLTQEVAAGP